MVVTFDSMSGSYPVGASPSVTVSGTSNKAGRTISADIYACSSKSYTTVASSTPNVAGTYDWSLVGIPVYDGWNSVSLSDGFNWQYIDVSTTNGSQDVSALTASVSGLTPTYQGTCGYQEYDAGAATTVTITGTTTAPDGTGNYTDPAGGSHSFQITNGTFTITGIQVFNGWNYISFYDTAWNYQYVYISTTNGVAKPQYLAITSPVQPYDGMGAMVMITGMNTVSGTITAGTTGFAPSVVRASVYNWATGNYTYYSSDSYEQYMYGDLPITYTANTFSLDVDFGITGDDIEVDVYAYDDATYANHGVTQEFNYPWGNYSNYYKPGAKATGATKNQAVNSEMMKQRLKATNRNR
jgi:hypothetical protein